MPWAAFTRQFGEIRQAGPGKVTGTGLSQPGLGCRNAFLPGLPGTRIFRYRQWRAGICLYPEDLAKLLNPTRKKNRKGRPSSRRPPGHSQGIRPAIPASDRFLDDATTCLAALRLAWNRPKHKCRPGCKRTPASRQDPQRDTSSQSRSKTSWKCAHAGAGMLTCLAGE